MNVDQASGPRMCHGIKEVAHLLSYFTTPRIPWAFRRPLLYNQARTHPVRSQGLRPSASPRNSTFRLSQFLAYGGHFFGPAFIICTCEVF